MLSYGFVRGGDAWDAYVHVDDQVPTSCAVKLPIVIGADLAEALLVPKQRVVAPFLIHGIAALTQGDLSKENFMSVAEEGPASAGSPAIFLLLLPFKLRSFSHILGIGLRDVVVLLTHRAGLEGLLLH